MATTVDELITLYTAKDQHSPIAMKVAASQERVAKASEAQLKALENVQRVLDRFTRSEDALSKSLDRQHAEMGKLSREYDRLSRSMGHAHAAQGKFSGVVAGIAAGVTNRALGWLGSMQDSMGGFYNQAIEAAMGAESLQARLEALTGSRALAQGKLKMAELVAAPSPFTTKQLQNATVTLEAFGINAERLLPTIGKLGAAMGADDERIQLYARALGELSTGKMIEAEARAAMGVSIPEFQKRGIRFDENNQLLSTASETMAALENIVNTKYGNIFDKMKNTAESRRASLEDAGERALRIIGDGMLKTQGPIVDALTKSLNAAVDSGVLAEVVGKVTKALGGVFGGDASNPMMRLMASAMSVIGNIPSAAGKALRFVGDTFSIIFENIATAGKFAYDTLSAIWRLIGGPSAMQDLLGTGPGQGDLRAYDRDNKASDSGAGASGGGIMDSLNIKPKWSKSVMQGGMLGTGSLQGLADLVVKMVGYTPGGFAMKVASPYLKEFALGQFGMGDKGLIPGLPALPKFKSLPQFKDYGGDVDLMKDAERYYKMLMGVGGKQGGIPDVSGVPFLRGDDLTGKLEKIKEATEKTARNTEPDLREAIFGGSSRARKAFSYADVMGGAAGRSGGYTIRTDKAATTLQMALLEVLQENLPDIFADYQRRAGVLS